MSSKNVKYAIYCRVSTNEQTPENQKIRLTEYAKEKGWDFDIYSEIESTRKTRPVKTELLHKLRNGEYDGVLIFKLDRWARSSTELILEIDELTKKGVVFKSLTDNLDFSTSSGRLHFQILSAFAEFERSLISERTKEGIYRAKMRGKTLGRPKGSKDKKKRRRAGYILREARKKQDEDQKKGIHMSIDDYLNKEE